MYTFSARFSILDRASFVCEECLDVEFLRVAKVKLENADPHYSFSQT